MAAEYLSASLERHVTGLQNPGGDSLLSISAWIKFPSGSAQRQIVSQDTPTGGSAERIWQFVVSSGNILQIVVWNNSAALAIATGVTTVADNTWHHVAGVFDGSNVYAYVDGVSDDATPPVLTGTLQTASVHFATIAARQDTGSENSNGQLAELAVWGVALSPGQILQLASGGARTPIHRMPLAVAAPAAYWPMLSDKPTGTVLGATDVRDWSGNGYHSTAVNGTPTSEAAVISILGAGPLIVSAEDEEPEPPEEGNIQRGLYVGRCVGRTCSISR